MRKWKFQWLLEIEVVNRIYVSYPQQQRQCAEVAQSQYSVDKMKYSCAHLHDDATENFKSNNYSVPNKLRISGACSANRAS